MKHWLSKMVEFTIDYDPSCLVCATQGYNNGMLVGVSLGLFLTLLGMIIMFKVIKLHKTKYFKRLMIKRERLKHQKRRINKMELSKIFPEKESVIVQPNVQERPIPVQHLNNKGSIFCVRCGIGLKKGWFSKLIEYNDGYHCDTCSWKRQKEINQK